VKESEARSIPDSKEKKIRESLPFLKGDIEGFKNVCHCSAIEKISPCPSLKKRGT